MINQKYIKSKLDCIEDKLCEIEKSTSKITSNNTLLQSIVDNTESYIANTIEIATLTNPSGNTYSTFKELYFKIISGTVQIEIAYDSGGPTNIVNYPILSSNGNIVEETFTCDTESVFSLSFTGTAVVYIRLKKQ